MDIQVDKSISFITKVGWYVYNTSFDVFVENIFNDNGLTVEYKLEKFNNMKNDFFGFFSSLDKHRRIRFIEEVTKRYGT